MRQRFDNRKNCDYNIVMVKVKVFAKVNTFLAITGIKDGYHALDSVVCTLDIFDEIIAKKSNTDQIVVNGCPFFDVQKIKTTIDCMRSKYAFGFVSVTIEKNVPLGAGLGGSSAPIAGVIRAIDKLFDLKLTDDEMIDFANLTGSDNAFMLWGGAGKIVDRSTPCNFFDFSPLDVVVAIKGFTDTKQTFKFFDEGGEIVSNPDTQSMICAMQNSDENLIASLSQNALTPFAQKQNEHIQFALKTLSPSFMSGAGSAVVSFDKDNNKIEVLKEKGYQVFSCKMGAFKTEIENYRII